MLVDALLTAMAEALQIVASGVTVAETALWLYRNLSSFVERVRVADHHAKDLVDSADSFRLMLFNIHQVVQLRRSRAARQEPDSDEGMIFLGIQRSLIGWSRSLSEFKEQIMKVKTRAESCDPADWVGKTLIQLRLDRKAQEIGRLKDSIKMHMSELQLMLYCLDV